MTYNILLVEDDGLSQDIITQLLESRGHQVSVAGDGFSALKILREGRFDVALVDYHLPEMDGYALARLMMDVSQSQHAAPKLIALTADQNGLAARRGADGVFSAIIRKPVAPQALFAEMDRVLTPAPAPAASSASGVASAAALWRDHGLSGRPRALAVPMPTDEQKAALDLCFELCEPARAEAILVIDRPAALEFEAVSRSIPAGAPVIGLHPKLADLCDVIFSVNARESWAEVAASIRARAAERPAMASEAILRPAFQRPAG